MGKGIRIAALGVSLAVAACSNEPAAVQNQTVSAAAPATPPVPAEATATAAASPLAAWIVGTWSFEESCATDFIVHYNQDGTLQNGEDSGSWKLEGNALTETISERFEMGAEVAEKIDPPEKRTYTVEQSGADTGTIAYRGKKIPIRRC